MSRRQARHVVLQALFQLDFNSVEDMNKLLEDVLAARDEHEKISPKLSTDDLEYVQDMVHGTVANREEIDQLIGAKSKEWRLERMPAIDRNILRMAVYEMKYSKEHLTPNIVINEAVELAKKFSTDDSGRFVNGILGSIVRDN